MKQTLHKISYHYQPTNRSCGYAALAILLSSYGITRSSTDIENILVPDDHEFGSITAEVANYCLTLNLDVQFYSFDFQITDFSWIDMPKTKILERLRLAESIRNIPSLGKVMSARYVRAYITLLESGAELKIAPHPTSQQLYKMLERGPVYINVCPKVLHGTGRVRMTGLRKSIPDDINGKIGTHSIVIYGNDDEGNFLIADPWRGTYVKPPETLICAVMSAEIECDSQCFQVLVAA